MITLSPGTRVVVIEQADNLGIHLWIPNLTGKTGVIKSIIKEYPEEGDVVYMVMMDESFQIHRPPEGTSSCQHIPDMDLAVTETDWAFTGWEIKEL